MKWMIFGVFGLFFAILMLPTTFVIVVGLLPTIAAFLIDRSVRKLKSVTVAAMNIAGIVPFLLELWTAGNSFDLAFQLVVNPKSIVMMYGAAAIGYLISWLTTNAVAAYELQKAKMRMKAIKKRQKELVDRWGEDVTGAVALDKDGYRIEPDY